MRDPYDGVLHRVLALPVVGEGRDQRLGVVVDEVVAGAPVVAARVDIRVVAVDQDVGVRRLQRRWEQVGGPEDAVLGRPRPLRVAI